MNSASYDIVLEMLNTLQTEQDDLQLTVNQNKSRVTELECYVQSFLDKEDSNFKIFSPRNAESVYKDEFQKSNAEINLLKNQNQECLHKIETIQSQINQLQRILEIEKANNSGANISDANIAILNIQEEDRRRIARDLHDTSLQNLAYLIHKIELCGLAIDQDPLRAKLELSVVSKNLKEVIDEIRNTIFDLRPMSFDDLGLKAAFERLLDVTNENKNYVIDSDIEDVSCENNLVLVTLYRIVQECFSNIDKHSEADRILFHCKFKNDFYHITIEDNGKGFTEDEVKSKQDRHFGMAVLKERVNLLGGTIVIQSKKGKGTRINMDIPMKDIFVKIGGEYGN